LLGSAPSDRSALTLAALVLGGAAVWLVLSYYFASLRFVVFDSRARTSFVVVFATGLIFGALVLLIVPFQAARERLRWVAAGFLVLGFGALGYGYAHPSVVASPSPNVSLYLSLYARTVATVLCAIGLFKRHLPPIPVRTFSLMVAGLALSGVLVIPVASHLPALVQLSGPVGPGSAAPADLSANQLLLANIEAGLQTSSTFPGLTAWHFGLSLIPLVASGLALWGAVRHTSAHSGIGLWLVLAMAVLASAQLHAVFWPTMSSAILSSTSLLRLALVSVVIVGGIVELAVVTRQRDTLLRAEQERTQRLEDLAQLKADFTSIVAHELANPVASIKVMAEIVALDDVPADLRRRTGAEIAQEAHMLEILVEDIREAASVERDDFRIDLRRIPVDRLVSEAIAYARRLPGSHPVSVENMAATLVVRGDPARLHQVLRNLLTNAARYTPDDTPITIRTRREPGEVVIEVADRGAGIAAADISRIFEKFGRGRDAPQLNASGRGLGLYLSRRILRLHGSDLVVESTPGQGTSFQFRLKEVP
jgi:signal transduction histidine kinase